MIQSQLILSQYHTDLQKLLLSLQKALTTVPPGHLRLSTKKSGHYYYYQRLGTSDSNGPKDFYIPRSNMELPQALAQKDYDLQLRDAVNSQISCLSCFLEEFDPKIFENLYSNLHPERQKLIDPRILPDAQFINQWQNESYVGKEFSSHTLEIYTEKGERVRSKSEKIIADFLFHNNIPYQYEHPLTIPGYGVIYPDFRLLNISKRQTIYWEHLGMMDDPEYAQKAVMKINRYICNGWIPGQNLILTYETRSCPLNTRVLQQLLKQHLL